MPRQGKRLESAVVRTGIATLVFWACVACSSEIAHPPIPRSGPEAALGGEKPTVLSLGYAETDISPPPGLPLGGYGPPGGFRVCEGIHDPLMAQVALFRNDAGQSFMIIAVDAIGYSFDFGDWGPGVAALRRNIAAALKDSVDIEPEHILLSSSHSHASTDLVGFWQRPFQGPSRSFLGELQRKITRAAVEASRDLQPIDLFHGHTELTGYSGRDDGCSEIIDNGVEIVQARNGDGAPVLSIVNYAKHPTLLGEDNRQASADYIWGFREEMRDQTGAPAMFLQGFIAAVHGGDLPVPGNGWDEVYAMGKIVADTVVGFLPSLRKARAFDIDHRSTVFSCSAKGLFVLASYHLLGIPMREIEVDGSHFTVKQIEVSWHRLGPVEFAAMPGEATPEYSLMLRDRMHPKRSHFIVGLANDEIGYIVDPGSLLNDPSGRLLSYEIQMGLGIPAGPAAWEAMESLGWFYPD